MRCKPAASQQEEGHWAMLLLSGLAYGRSQQHDSPGCAASRHAQRSIIRHGISHAMQTTQVCA
jgi:hypothetical protein